MAGEAYKTLVFETKLSHDNYGFSKRTSRFVAGHATSGVYTSSEEVKIDRWNYQLVETTVSSVVNIVEGPLDDFWRESARIEEGEKALSMIISLAVMATLYRQLSPNFEEARALLLEARRIAAKRWDIDVPALKAAFNAAMRQKGGQGLQKQFFKALRQALKNEGLTQTLYKVWDVRSQSWVSMEVKGL